MATSASASSLFTRLVNVWRLLSLRSDVDNIILELLGHFSLEKIYSEGDKETYQQLVITLIAQLNAIFYIQRLSLPSENSQVGWYLGFLVSWEVTLRTVEFVLQIIVEGRESLWEADLDFSFLISALRVLILHVKAPSNQRPKDRRERWARLHRLLERIYDSYPGQKSFLLLVCKEITDSLRTEPNGLALPHRLRYELPNLASELYPLPECLSADYITAIVPQDGFTGSDWLSQFLALRDVSQFVVGASVQYTVNRERKDFRLQSSSSRSRNAVLRALERLQMPLHLNKMDLMATFSDTFRIILPDTLNLARRDSSETHTNENEMDAIDSLCARLSQRQVVQRVSDRQMMHNVSQVTRNIALLDDPSGQFRSARPRVYALNCSSCHLAGETQLRSMKNLKFPTHLTETAELSIPPQSTCIHCGESITMGREMTFARHTWDLLKPLEVNADTINVERHIQSQFQLAPPRLDAGIFRPTPSYGNIIGAAGQMSPTSPDDMNSPHQIRPLFSAPSSSDPSRSTPQSSLLPSSPGFKRRMTTPRTELSENMSSIEGTLESPKFPDSSASSGVAQPRNDHSNPVVSIGPPPPPRRPTAISIAPSETKKKTSFFGRIGSRKDTSAPSFDSSSISSTTLEQQRLDEISLKSLTSGKISVKGRNAKNINVCLSQNSTFALFWTQPTIHLWDVGSSPPSMKREIATEGNCVLAAVTKMHLAYIVGTRDRLTLRIMNLLQPSTPVVQYQMSSSLWCKSIAICPKEIVAVGFENSTVRFFRTTNTEQPREDRLHSKYHKECRECPAVDNLSFSHDGLVLLGSTRNAKSGTIQVFAWRFPFTSFQEIPTCRYHVPLHESEDNGVSSAIFRTGSAGEEDLVAITTWTQSGTPILLQPESGHRTDIRNETSSRPGRLGNRIQCASFSPTGRDIAMVNDKGHLYHISGLNSSPMDIRRIATSRELTAKSDAFGMAFMKLLDEDAIVLAWVDPSKAVGFVRKIPVTYNLASSSNPATPGFAHVYAVNSSIISRAELQGDVPTKRPSLTITEEPVNYNDSKMPIRDGY